MRGIAGRLAVIFSLLVVVATSTVGFLVFWRARESLVDSLTDRLEHTATTVEVRLFASLEAISKDVLFLAETPPVPGIVRAYYGPYISPSDGRYDVSTNHSEREWRSQLSDIFTVFLQNRPSYVQVRYVGLAEDGRELLGARRQGDEVTTIPIGDLQPQGHRAYLTETVALEPGAVYLSDVELERLDEDTVAPVPVLRVATPIFDARGQPFGVLVVDVDFRHVLRTISPLADAGVSIYLAKHNGDLLLQPDSTRLRNMDGAQARLQDAFPRLDAWLEAEAASTVPLRTDSRSNAPVLTYFEQIPFYDRHPRHFVVGVTAPRAAILSRVTTVRNRSTLITVLFAVWGIVLALVVSRYLTRSIRQITRAVEHFGSDEAGGGAGMVDLPVQRKDEIGVLARTFDTMAQQLQAQIAELEDRAHRQRIILETSAEGIIVTDAAGRIETFNRAAEQIFGYAADEVTGRSVNELVFTVDADVRTNGRPRAADDPRWVAVDEREREVMGRRKDGTAFPLSLALSSFELGGEMKYAGFLQDITARKEYETTLREAKHSAEAANMTKSAFLANMSHEIRTPLTGIIGFASLLSRQVSGKHRKYAQLIERSAERLKETLNSVLNLAKLESNRINVDLSELLVHEDVQEVVQLFQGQAQQKGLTLVFRVEHSAEHAHARLDRGALSSILHNLLGNAVKFTEEGGIVVTVDADGERVFIHVQDSGVGIDPAFMPHLFDEFRQESTGFSRTHEGSGLGLSITQRLIRLMGGDITVRSEKGAGSTFTVAFPKVVQEPETPVLDEEPLTFAVAPEEPGQTRVLVVEDNENTQVLLEGLLEDTFEVAVVASAEEALLEAFRNDYDLVLMDINLGEGPNGADVLRELRAMPTYRDVPIVALTAYALPGDRERFLDMGFTAYLSKPFNADELLDLTARL